MDSQPSSSLRDPHQSVASAPQGGLESSSTSAATAPESDLPVPEPIDACVHSLFKQVVCERPQSPAICAWDGALSYAQLDLLSSRLARQLGGLGVKSGSSVVLCFEKSLLAPVAVLAVAKAGGVSILLNPSESHTHLQAIVAQVPQPIVVSSTANAPLSRQLVTDGTVVILRDELLSDPRKEGSSPANVENPAISPSDTFNIIFHSDSSQSPCGAAITHQSMSTALVYQQKPLGYSADVRVFDLAAQGSYLAWCTLLHTLTSGGCLCIPSERDREHNVETSMIALRANAVHLTPAMADGLDHARLAGRVRLTLVGETQAAQSGKTERSLTGAYNHGAEWASLGTQWAVHKSKVSVNSGRYGDGFRVWVTEPSNLPSCASCETCGELWLEGPLLGHKYPCSSGNEVVFFKQSIAALSPPLSRPGASRRSHRIGDLVRQEGDGMVVLLEKEDLAIRTRQSSVDDESERNETTDADQSGESIDNLHSSSESDGALETPATPATELGESTVIHQISLLWAQLFQLSPQTIKRKDDFFKLGGDATKALCLVKAARDRGLNFTVRDIYQTPSLANLAALANTVGQIPPLAVPAFSLMGSSANDDMLSRVAQLCRVQKSQVADLLPCSPLQQGMLALTQIQPGSYVEQQVFELDEGICVDRLRRAWDLAVAMNPILRTRIVSLPGHGLVQAVLDEGPSWMTAKDLGDLVAQQPAPEQQMGLGTPLSRFAIVDAGDGRRPHFCWEIHHALYDGWSLLLLLNEAEQAYYGEAGQDLEPMAGFIKYIQDRDETAAKTFWRAQFEGIEETHYPSSKAAELRRPQPASHMSLAVPGLNWGRSDFTQGTIARAAWAVVMARHGNSSEALYGVTVTGRQAEVPGIELMSGPAIATVPVRVKLNWESSVNQLLEAVQEQATDMIPFEQTGLQRIRRMGEAAATACAFQSLLVVQPGAGEGDSNSRPFLSKPEEDETAKRDAAPATYAIELECELGAEEANLRIDFDAGVISEREMRAIAQDFDHVLRHLADQTQAGDQLGTLSLPSRSASNLNRIEEVLAWNAKLPEAVDECVHRLFVQRARESPEAAALCAWDGKMTYQELDEHSERLACRLVARGVTGKRVPLLFEKSLWMPVAVLAVLKAGGAIVALEMKEPAERLQSIISRTTSSVLLSSVQNSNLAQRLIGKQAEGEGEKEVLLVGHHAASDPDQSTSVLPDVDPSCLLYVVFTSGSTGTPKGVLISHRNFCSAIAHQQQALDYHRNARVLDFASCAFDVAWSNLFLTLTAGACFCIPSPAERENDLAGCLTKYDVTFADLTPSVARALGSESLSRLTTMILGGEGPLPSDASLVDGKTHIINAYSPAECTPTSTLSTLDPTNVTIGRGLGLCTWVVDPDNADVLAPLGSVGELWLEGPLVGMGYLDDPERTAAAFIDDPTWLMQAVGRRGRVYRSGDLVRYQDDGKLVFIGRKDTQVKIRGQRVELSEVESCVRRVIDEPKGTEVVAETVQPAGANNPILVAFVALPDAETMGSEAHEAAVIQATKEIPQRLREVVPSYMVPAAFLPIQEIPVTTAGKIDRKRLRALGASMWPQYRNSGEKKGASSQPTNEIEALLQSVWMSVLNLTAEEASVDAGFSSLGGDSISAMQLVSRCRLHNIVFTVSDILQANTIRKIAARRRHMSTSAVELLEEAERQDQEDAGAVFNLSPMQQTFFNEYPNGLNHFNQSFLLDLGDNVSAELLSDALTALVNRHAMLRARFHQDPDSGIWKQSIAQDIEESFVFAHHSVSHRDDVGKAGQWRQESLDICHGPVFACDLFDMPNGGQIVLLSAHHLVIDLVSWRIVWNDVEEYIRNGELRSPKALSFRAWCAIQAKVGSNLSPLAVLPYPIPEPEVAFWGLPDEQNIFGECDTFDVALPLDASKLLFSDSNTSLRTEAVDLILGILAQSFAKTFPERTVPAIWIEGHGREQFDGIPTDVSGTVGWFTTMYPLAVTISPTNPSRTRESGRQAFKGHDILELVFNFTGRFQQLERDDGLFKASQHGAEESDVKISEISKSARRYFIMEIGAVVSDNVLVVSWNFNKHMKHQDRVEQWTQTFVEDLESAARQLAKAPAAFTLSDFPLLQLSYRGLDMLLSEQLPKIGITPRDIANAYPCSPLQEGMLLSAIKGAASYITYSVWRCVPSAGNPAICPRRLEEAWKKVVSRHIFLSTIFVLHPEGNGFMQLVLENAPVRVEHIVSGPEGPTTTLDRLPEPSFAPREPEHALTICQAQNGEVACRLDMSHGLTDAHSASIILNELTTLYEGGELSPAPAFSEMIRFINAMPKAQTLASWTSLLDGLEPCEFPLSPAAQSQDEKETYLEINCPGNFKVDIGEFCKKAQIMPSTLLQVAWAMVLSHITGKHDVCYGNLASGRDAPVERVESLVGPLANMLVGRVDLGKPARQVLETTVERSKQHMSIQHVSLAEILHHLGLSGRRLFNTSLSLRAATEKGKSEESKDLSFDVSGGGDAHEFDVKLNVSMSGSDIDVSIEFREPHVERRTAVEAGKILHRAIDYLLTVDFGTNIEGTEAAQGNLMDANDQETLQEGFFRHVMGVDLASATIFWKAQFANTQGTHFPPLSTSSLEPVPYEKAELTVDGLEWASDVASVNSAVKTAWAVLAARFMGADESIFGFVNESNEGITSFPVRIVVDGAQRLETLLSDVERQGQEMARLRGMSLARISRLNEDADTVCNFQTLLAVDPSEEAEALRDPSLRPLTVVVRSRPDGAHIDVIFDPRILEKTRATRLTHGFTHLLRQVLNAETRQLRIQDIAAASPMDLADIWRWNNNLPAKIEGLVHEWILDAARERPTAPAIHAWDGKFKYEELAEISLKLAKRLISLGVGRGSIVPLCFEKSRWMPVAALAVFRAGGAAVAVDTAQPEDRIRTITTQVFHGCERPKVLISSIANHDLAHRLSADEVVIVGDDQPLECQVEPSPELPSVETTDIIYAVFTSGSTGKPKGVLINHQNFCSAVHYQRAPLGVHRDSRVYDFSSYAFDVAWLSVLKALTAGACLCIPSAAEREDDLGGSLEKYEATIVDLTPSVARAIEPRSALSRLSTLLIGGEPVVPSDADLAGEKTQITVAYGPAECTPTSSIMNLTETRGAGIGRGVGMCMWIVDIENPSALAPVGAVGELWLEGPLVGQGYLHEPEKTKAAFVLDPAWLVAGPRDGKHPGRRGRTYRTGDLVRYKDDGSLLFVGRKDTQVKIRGQRVELGDVEHHVYQTIKPTTAKSVTNLQVVVETFQPTGMTSKMLVAFIALESAQEGSISPDEYDGVVRNATSGVSEQLAKTLPGFMIPSLYLPIRAIPMSATGKADRRRLQEIGAKLSAKDIKALGRSGGRRRTAETEDEQALQALWAEILGVEGDSIGADDSFFRIGGDSLGAMRLVGKARYRGFGFNVRDVFQSPILADLAALKSVPAKTTSTTTTTMT